MDKHRPPLVISENVCSAPWDRITQYFAKKGYSADFLRVDTKQYYIPHTRTRVYLLAVNSRGSSLPSSWKDMVNNLKWPALTTLDNWICLSPGGKLIFFPSITSFSHCYHPCRLLHHIKLQKFVSFLSLHLVAFSVTLLTGVEKYRRWSVESCHHQVWRKSMVCNHVITSPEPDHLTLFQFCRAQISSLLVCKTLRQCKARWYE